MPNVPTVEDLLAWAKPMEDRMAALEVRMKELEGGNPPAPPPPVPPPPNPPVPAEPILREVGTVNVSGGGQKVEGVLVKGQIKATNSPGLVVKNVRVEVPAGLGHAIELVSCSAPIISDVSVEVPGWTKRRLPREQRAIHASNCPGLAVARFMQRNTGSIYIFRSDRAVVQFLAGFDTRCHELNTGGDPRGYSGQLIQFNQSPEGRLADFSVINDLDRASTVDNVSIHESSRCRVERGLIDGNTDPAGVGVMVEAGSRDCYVGFVDMIRGCNGAFSVYQGSSAIMEEVRSRDLQPLAREPQIAFQSGSPARWTNDYRPKSGGGMHFVADPSANNVARYRRAVYWGRGGVTWRDDFMAERDIRMADFKPRDPISLTGSPFTR